MGITTAYSYDKDKNITSLVAKNPQGAAINNISYTYDNNGNQLTKVENNKTTTYTYDQLNRLATVQYPELGLETYTYDNEGNRKTKVLGTNTTSYLYDSRNKLVQSTNNSIITSYNYDKNGNLLDESKNGQKITYTYDDFNHLKEVNLSNETWMYNEYNATGERIAIAENGVRSEFVIDRGNVIAEIDPSTQNYTRSVRGIGLLAQSGPNGVLGYYLDNAHGDVLNMVDSNGQALNSYQYDAFGNATSNVEKVTNRFMYSGEQFDKLTGQYYLRARYYNPVVGRFTQEDTYRGDGLNLYVYVSNNPVRYIDPSGHDKEDVDDKGDTTSPAKPGVNPSRVDVITYITIEANQRGIPEQLALATAWTENSFKQFDKNGSSGPNASGDYGLMQINKVHKNDSGIEWDKVISDWKYNVEVGLRILKDCYNTAVRKGEGTNGVFTGSEEEDLACSAYSLYNSGSAYFRYRTTYNEAKSQYKGTKYEKYIDGYYNGPRDGKGYDRRDINFRNNYEGKRWEN